MKAAVSLTLYVATNDAKEAAEVVNHWFAGDEKASESIYDIELGDISFPTETEAAAVPPESVPEPELDETPEAQVAPAGDPEAENAA